MIHRERIMIRKEVRPEDRDAVRRIVESTGFFHPAEADVAVELVDEALKRGSVASGYHFLFAEAGEKTLGYSCFGPIPCTLSSFDLYWIAVSPESQGLGLGRRLVEETERAVKKLKGTRIYIETSNREQYVPTRAFYLKCGYAEDAVLRDFYGPKDDKVIYVKVIQ